MGKLPMEFATYVFDENAMKEYLPEDTFKALSKTVSDGKDLDRDIADSVACGMKEWAISKGATHFTHWFQPLTGVTAEKHDSFLNATTAAGSGAFMDFSGSELIKSEPDASSFPSGGLRATFEARGYTAWDPTSYAFVKGNTLCIPSVFCSYGGDILDKKTPLLRSMELLKRNAMRVLRYFSSEIKSVNITAGPEQEYFLVDKELADKRLDLVVCGRTLFGAKPPKGQELDDHYYGTIKSRVSGFMRELDEELWKLGVFAKTEHNEVAPAQHELAIIYRTANIAADHNQLVMEIAQKTALKHNLVCLLHEKPFEGVNGSGKHINWSLSTDKGENLLDPGDSPENNARFLLFLCAVLKAVDDYQDILRLSVATAGNDLRLGGNEAPPAIISIFLGSELTEILEAIEKGNAYDHKDKTEIKIGVHSLPRFFKDATDRNRTSPFAFTGNKFEFRMLGASASVSDAIAVLNTAVADVLGHFADSLDTEDSFTYSLNRLIKKTISSHKRIIFNGNNYSDEWIEEAEKRGLLNISTTVDALPVWIERKTVELFTKNAILTEQELHSRLEIGAESYCKTVFIESSVMVEMAKKHILPSIYKYSGVLAASIKDKAAIGIKCESETKTVNELVVCADDIFTMCSALESHSVQAKQIENSYEAARFCRDVVLRDMNRLRLAADKAEQSVADEYWLLPTYSELLFSVN